jgi:flagellar hook-basal body complex protein FliE
MAINVLSTQRLVPGLIEGPNSGTKLQNPEAAGKQAAFADMLTEMLESVNQVQQESGQMQQAFLAGEPVELHQLMIKAEEAGVATDLLLEVRNKLLDAYREIMRMPM